VPELVACAAAVLAVIDSWTHLWLAPVLWAAILLIGAGVLAAVRGRSDSAPAWVRHHAALGLLLTAVLQLAAISTGSTPAIPTGEHHHGVTLGSSAIGVIASTSAVGYAVLTVPVVRRALAWRPRLIAIAMAAAVLLMAGSIVG